MLGMVFPIVYNFGTNIFLGQISYITEALATVLQLGVTMDFSIFLLHRFEEEKRSCPDEDEAMVRAVQKTFSSILASSLTTIAGFLAMCTMRLTLGRDIGIVMAKGVLLGVVSTVTILPALILTFRRSIARHTHRTFIPKLRRTSRFVVRGIFPSSQCSCSASFHSAWRRRKRLYTTHYSTACRRTSRGFRVPAA